MVSATAWAFVLVAAASAASAATPPPESAAAREEARRLNQLPPVPPPQTIKVDPSGRPQKGEASFYAPKFTNRPMADGKRMDPRSNVAASKSLPLGSTAKVKNLENGKTATVKVQDRGPFVKGRVVDLSPKIAEDLDIKKSGVAPVEVKPLTVPQPDGSVKLGAGAAESTPQEIRNATAVTKALTGEKTTAVAQE